MNASKEILDLTISFVVKIGETENIVWNGSFFNENETFNNKTYVKIEAYLLRIKNTQIR